MPKNGFLPMECFLFLITMECSLPCLRRTVLLNNPTLHRQPSIKCYPGGGGGGDDDDDDGDDDDDDDVTG